MRCGARSWKAPSGAGRRRRPPCPETSSLRPEALPVLQGADLAHTDVFSLLEDKLGLTLGWAEVTTEAVSADEATATLLRIRAGAPLLLLHRLTYLDDETPFD